MVCAERGSLRKVKMKTALDGLLKVLRQGQCSRGLVCYRFQGPLFRMLEVHLPCIASDELHTGSDTLDSSSGGDCHVRLSDR